MKGLIFNAKRYFFNAVSVVKRVTVGLVGVGMGVVSLTSNVYATSHPVHVPLTFDNANILADVSSMGQAVMGVILAIIAISVAIAMMRKAR